MASYQTCKASLNAAVGAATKKLSTIVSNNIKDPVLKETVSQDVVNYIKDSIKGTFGEQRVDGSLESLLADASTQVHKAAAEVVDQFKKMGQIQEELGNRLKTAKNAREAKGVMDAYFEDIEAHNVRAENNFALKFQNTIDNLGTAGRAVDQKTLMITKEAVLDALAGGDKLNRLLVEKGVNDPEMAIHEAMHKGTNSLIPELDLVGRLYTTLDNSVVKDLKDSSIYFNRAEGYVVSLGVDRNRMALVDSVQYKDSTLKRIRVDETLVKNGLDISQMDAGTKQKYIDEFLNENYTRTLTDKSLEVNTPFKNTKGFLSQRIMVFKSAGDEYAYFKEFGLNTKGVFAEAMANKRRSLKKAAMYDVMGGDLGASLRAMQDSLNDTRLMDADSADALIKRHADRLRNDLTPRSQGEIDNELIIQGLSSLVSATLTPHAAARNAVYDNTVHTAQATSQLTGNTVFKEYLNTTSELMKGVYRGTGKGKEKVARDILSDVGLVINVSYSDTINQTSRIDLTKSASNKAINFFHEKAQGFAQAVSKYTLADRTYQASRLATGIHMGRHLNRVLTQDWTDMNVATKQAFKDSGITEDVFEFLKTVPRLEAKGYGEIVLDTHNFSKGDIKKLAKASLPLEDSGDTAKRLVRQYSNLLVNLTNDASAIVTQRGTVGAKRTGNLLVDIMVSQTFKFANISISQYFGMLRSFRRASGLTSNDDSMAALVELAKSNPVKFGAMVSTATVGGVMLTWSGDLREGKTPRDLTPRAMYESFLSSGFGGIVGYMMGTLYFNEDIVGSPVKTVARPVVGLATGALKGDKKRVKKESINAFKRFMPLADSWYTRLAFRKLFLEGLLGVKEEPSKRKRDRRLGKKELF